MTDVIPTLGVTVLADDELLADADLETRPGRDGQADPELLDARVHCGLPLVFPVDAADLPPFLRARAGTLGRRYVGLLLAFDLDPPPPGRAYRRVRFTAALDDPRAVAVQVHADGDALGLWLNDGQLWASSALAARAVRESTRRRGWLGRLAARAGRARARTTGVQTHRFSWSYDDPAGRGAIGAHFAMPALLEMPADLVELAGSLSVELETAMPTGRQPAQLAGTTAAIRFRQPLLASAPPLEAGAAMVRLCVAADVERYSRQRNPMAERTQRHLTDILRSARARAGLAESAVHLQPQGDEEFAILPAGIDESTVIPELVAGMVNGLRDVNAARGAQDARLRLRVAMHRGLMKPGASGWVGVAPVAVHRILNAPVLRTALAGNADADLVLGVPDVLYQDVIAHGYGSLDPELFARCVVDLPDKDFVEHAWIHVAHQ
jgi:hypothetical protein